MKLWIDDLRPAPPGWTRATSVEQAKVALRYKGGRIVEIMSLDHDAGDFAKFGGDYIEILKWLESEVHSGARNYVPIIHIHTNNPVGRANMEAIINANGWREASTI